MSSDQLLSDETPAPEPDGAPELPEHDAKTFDVGALVNGVRATRVRVKIQPNAHLLERLQELAEEIDDFPGDDDVPQHLIDEWVETKEAFDHEDTFVVEGRTTDWVKNHHAEAKKRGINPGRKGMSDSEVHEHLRRLYVSQVAEQVVKPEVTEEQVMAIFLGNEAEGDKLWRAVQTANTQPVKALVPDFSQRVSRLSRRG